MKTFMTSSLTKVFKDKELNFDEFTSFSSLMNEPFSFQVAVKPEKKAEEKVKVTVNGALAKFVKIYEVKNIPAKYTRQEHADKFFYLEKRSEYPDLLMPLKEVTKLQKGEWTSFWFEYVPQKEISGKKKIGVKIEAGKEIAEKVFNLDIIPAKLPEQKLLFTNWFHNDCICTWYNLKPFSEEYWIVVKEYIQNAVDHGMNMILTPVFTPPLDTEIGKERPTVQLVDVTAKNGKYKFGFENFEKYVSLCLSCGIKAFEISHLFTQWGAKCAPKVMATVDGVKKRIFGWETEAAGAEYTAFLKSFAKAFDKEVTKLGIKEKCWLHVSDEPGLEAKADYKRAADTIHKFFPDYNTFDAMSDIDFYKEGLIKNPVCCEDEADLFRSTVKNFWTYYCCGQTRNNLPNRMFAMPSLRNRILGTLLFKYDAVGFLQWGHNFWYSHHARRGLDPFKESDSGEAFPAGDAYVVYPGEDKKPLNSLRHLVFFEGFCDMRAMRLLEALTSKEEVMKILEKNLDLPLSFSNYPHEQKWLLGVRSEINETIKANLK